MSLDTRAEVSKLARTLDVEPVAIEGVDALSADDLRRLRHLVSDALHDAHRGAFQRAASASALLPATLTARLAETMIGPYLAARIAAEMPPDRSVKLAGHLSVSFLADVCHSLDPGRVSETVQGLPDATVLEVGMTLLERGEHVTLARFVDIVHRGILRQMANRIHDRTALFEIAVSVEARHRLDDLIELLTDEQLDGLVRAAAEQEGLVAGLALMTHLDEEGRRRIVSRVADAGPDVLDDIVRVTHQEQAWGEVLPLLAAMESDDRATVMQRAQTTDPDVLRAIVVAADDNDLWADLIPLVAQLDDARLEAISQLDDVLTPELLARLVSVGLDHQDLWPDLVRTISRVPEERQVVVAERIASMPGVSVKGLLALARTVPGASDLPGFRALADREA